MKKLLPLFFIGLLTLARAQDLACESLFANYPKPTIEITSMEQTITTSSTVDGQEMQVTMSQTIDYTNRRLYQETNAMGMNTITRYSDGKASSSMKMGEETMDVPMPAEAASALEAAFDQGMVQGLPENYTIVSCDGPQSYAGLLEGEQVTVSSDIPGMGAMTSKIIFAPDGKTSGAVSTIPNQGDMLIVFDTMTLDASNVPTEIIMSMYQFDGTNATPFGTTTINITSYNQPVDDSLFAE
jgi:hypothetical protein